MGEWKECVLGELIETGNANLQTGPFGTMLNSSEYSMAGIPVIAVQNIGNNQLLYSKLVYVSDEVAERLSRYRLQENDIIFGRKGAVDRRSLIKKNESGWLQGSDCIRLRLDETIDPEFISFQFGTKAYREWMLQFSIGATMPSLNQQILKLLPINLPPLPEQKAIASVLSSLDDKIDLLHRQNKTLETMAETLFRQWFVEEAQDDWEEGSIFEFIDLLGGGTPKISMPEYWDGSIPWLSGGDIASNHKSFVQDTPKHITEKGLCNSSAKLLPKYATVISARGTVGKYCMLSQPMAFSQSNYGILPKNSENYFFTYLLINHVVEELQSSAYGSVFDTITTATFKELEVLLTPMEEILRFENSVSSFFEKMLLNNTQIRTLQKLRDTLLPKLMSGEVRVEYEH